jgi:flavin reductase (DIM6/NTAB) family NADH-FMN oxidoreductase RutF
MATRLKSRSWVSLVPSVAVDVPRVEECRAHFECVYDSDRRFADEVWIFGEIVFACVDEKALEGSSRERYRYLDPIFYLEGKTYGALGRISRVKP